jgi:L,D-transpeptidase YcbB
MGPAPVVSAVLALRTCVLFTLLGISATSRPLVAQRVVADPDTVTVRLITATHPWLSRDGRFSDVQTMVRSAFDRDSMPLTWLTDAGRPSPQTLAVLSTLASSEEVTGVDRNDLTTIDSVARRFVQTPATGVERAEFDVAMSVVVARHAAQLRQGRVNPRWVHNEWSLAAPDFDAAGLLRTLAAGSATPAQAFAALEPQTEHYRRLKAGLARVRVELRDSAALRPPMPVTPVRLNGTYNGMPTLARLLIALGEVPASTDTVSTRFRGPVAEAVRRRLQRAMKRGRVRAVTLDSAMVQQFVNELPLREQRLQLAVERWRWLPRTFPNQPLVVNLPAFRLETYGLFTGDSSTGLNMNVVIGRADSNATPVFAANMNQIVFSPRWHVPMSIMTKEIGPKAQANPSYLSRNGYELVRRGRVVSATAANIAAIGTGVYVRQQPGNSNSLGLVKFLMPNPYDIYLHDTPSKRLFNAERRDFSHGCVRLANPTALAQYVLAGQPVWTEERIGEAMRSGEEKYVRVPRPIPVLVIYQTAVARADGSLRYFEDVYGHDRELWAAYAGRGLTTGAASDGAKASGQH